MKIRNFYPCQVVKRLHGQHLSALTPVWQHVLSQSLQGTKSMVVIEGTQIFVTSRHDLGNKILADLKNIVRQAYGGGV